MPASPPLLAPAAAATTPDGNGYRPVRLRLELIRGLRQISSHRTCRSQIGLDLLNLFIAGMASFPGLALVPCA